ncbi:MAG TPA: hypothetical protein VMF14_13510 [Solirubrobacteraceae bacterium]|nr:hypothetical protein [Solirubrobacteraceae bacterium]
MKRHAAHHPGGHRRSAVAIRPAAALAAVGCAAALGACGSSGAGGPAAVGGTTATGDASPLGLSQCMRAHGVTDFPDPSNGPGGQGLSISATPGSPTLTVQGVTFSGPAFERAEKACSRYLTAKGPPPQPSARQRARLLAFAKCVRAHGVPSFADPGGGAVVGGVVASKHAPASVDAPAFRRALAACGGLRTP